MISAPQRIDTPAMMPEDPHRPLAESAEAMTHEHHAGRPDGDASATANDLQTSATHDFRARRFFDAWRGAAITTPIVSAVVAKRLRRKVIKPRQTLKQTTQRREFTAEKTDYSPATVP